MGDLIRMEMTVNGRHHTLEVSSNTTLLDLLRDTFEQLGPKECCGVGECGACTVSVDGRTVNSCLVLAIEADGAEITTVEGLARAGELSVLQEAFLDYGAVQCGFCIPGMLMSAQALLDQNPQPDDEEIREGLSGNLCRCGGYKRMVEAVHAASEAGGSGASASATLPPGDHASSGRHRDDHAPVCCGRDAGNSVGTSVRRLGGRERVSGTQQFLADIPLKGMLHVKLVTLDVARARIISVDAAEARIVPGFVDIMTANELPNPVPRFGPAYKDRPVLAVGETKYHGEPVAALVAEFKEAAELAAALVRVEHEVLPAVFSVAGALAQDAPLVQDPELRVGDPLAATNVLKERRYGWGDVDNARADLVVANSYTFPMVTHFAIEPHGFIASMEGDGLKVWSPGPTPVPASEDHG